MPALKKTDIEEKRSRARSAIKRYEELRSKSDEQMAIATRMHIKTFQKKKRNPELFGLDELWNLSQFLKCPIEELCGGTGMEVKEVEILAQAIRELITVKGDN